MQKTSFDPAVIHFEDGVCWTDDPIELRNAICPFPCQHIVHNEIALFYEAVTYKTICPALLTILIERFCSGFHAVVFRNGE